MTTHVGILNPSLTDQEGHSKFLDRLFTPGVATTWSANSLKVVQRGAGANMSVDVSTGDGQVERPAGDYAFWIWQDAVSNVTITTAPATNSRIDAIVAWVNTGVTTTASVNSPGALVFQAIAGTASGSPVAPTDSAIQTALGSTVAWTRLANVTVGTNVTSIVAANIADARTAITMRAALASNAVSSSSMIGSGIVSYANLLSTIFGAQVLSQANAGTAGGTIYYVNLGGIKLAWGETINISVSGTGFLATSPQTVTFPTSFFTTIQSALASVTNTTTFNGCEVSSKSTTAMGLVFEQFSGSNGSGNIDYLVIGT